MVVQKLLAKDEHKDAISRSVIGNFVLDTVARATDKAEQQLVAMTKRWQNREISNVCNSKMQCRDLPNRAVCVSAIAQSTREPNSEWLVKPFNGNTSKS